MRTLLTALIIVLIFAITGLGAGFYPFDGVSASGGLSDRINESSLAGSVLELTANGVFAQEFAFNGENYAGFSWENSGVSGIIGQSEIPVYRFYLEIPYGAKVDITLSEEHRLEYNIKDIVSANRLLPVQPPLEKVKGARNEFVIDENYYSRNSYLQSPVAEVEDYIVLRGHYIAVIAVKLLDYNPAAGKVAFYARLNLRFNYTGGDMSRTMQNLRRYNSMYFNKLVHGLVRNPGIFATDELPDPPGILIICEDNPNFMSIIEPFAEWKRDKGFDMNLVTTAATGNTNTQIKNYITNAYFTWDIPPTFVLLVGDSPEIPHWIGSGAGSPHTDLYYAAIDGADYFADLGVGRFSPGNAQDLINMVDKTMSYEHVGWTGNDDWEKHAVFMASNDNWSVSEGTHNYVIQNYLIPAGYNFDRLYCHTFSATTAQTSASFNAGRSQGTYSGHGSTTGWADGPPFSQANVEALYNSVYPLVQSYSCLTGQFSIDECFGETWSRHSSGALSFWGSSVTSYWNEDDVLEKGVYEGMFNNQAPGDTVNFTWINGMTDYGKMSLYNYYGPSSTIQRYFEMYNLLGDGSVDLWMDIPQAITVNHPAVVYLGSSEVTVQVSGQPGWALVCAHSTAESNVWASGYVGATGSVTFTFDSAPVMPGEMVFTVTGHNAEPYIGSVPLVPVSGPYIVYNSVEIDDQNSWMPNGQLDFGEQVFLNLTVENVGIQTASNVQIDISSSDPNITILDGSEVYGEILAGTTATVPLGFEIEAAENVPDLYSIPFTLTARSGADIWESYFNITAHAPVIEFEDIEIIDDVTGNGNGCLDPGETATFRVYLKNNGSCNAQNLNIEFTVLDPGLTIPPDTYIIPFLAPEATGSVEDVVTVAPDLPQNTRIEWRVDITASGNYTAEDFFSTLVGDILNLPTGPDNYGYFAYDPWDAPDLEYQWYEISADSGGPGSWIPFTLDDQVFPYPLPFTFQYYGVEYDSFTVSANGWISMGICVSDDYSNSGIPNGDGPPAMIAPLWEDLSPQRTNSGKVWQYYDETNHQLIVEYNHIEQYTPTGNFETFQLFLLDPEIYPTATGDGQLLFQYKDMSTASEGEGTIGIENHLENDGLEYRFDDEYDVHAHPITDQFVIHISTANSAPTLSFTLTPVSTPITIPPQGGSFQYDLLIENVGDVQAGFTAWTDAILPNGSNYGPILLRPGLSLAPGASISRTMTQNVPGSAPSGNYEYWGHAGVYPGTVWAEDSFPFTKAITGDASGKSVGDWNIAGWEDSVSGEFAVIPDKFSLSQNYPNPFNPSTSFDFTLADNAKTSVQVYDVLGRLTATLVEGTLSAGYYTIKWDAGSMSAGIYFVRLEAGDFTAVRKVILMK